jgi:hypothetical protein
MQAADWRKPEKHESTVIGQSANRADLRRTLDDDGYFVAIAWGGEARFGSDKPAAAQPPGRGRGSPPVRQSLTAQQAAEPLGSSVSQGTTEPYSVTGGGTGRNVRFLGLAVEKPHTFLLVPAGEAHRLEFVVAFAQRAVGVSLPTAVKTFAASARHWQRFWGEGGVIELAASRDWRAPELERRIVLSQYLTAIQCAGSTPPQETGLTVNSWHGKFHLEMHWWHAAHFALWNRLPLLERSLAWYSKILPQARERARQQGYAGCRWPKMTGPEGRDSPSPIGPLLIWQQPHPIFFAELCYRARSDRATLARYRQIVLESAEFMASYAFLDAKAHRYVLGPPVIPAQENHPPRETWNPTFELAYWAWGLEVAQKWLERLGLPRSLKWDEVTKRLSPLPVLDGVYLAHENCPQTFTQRNYDHPSMLGTLGMLPGDGVDREVMSRTLVRVIKQWQWDRTWGWDYPMTAMSAARLGEQKTAVDALMMDTAKNHYLANGHNWQRRDLPCYLPGNGALLYAVAMMAGGWKGAPHSQAPGFPDDGSWTVRCEGLNSTLLGAL